MKKIQKFLLVAFVSTVPFVSCSKSDPGEQPNDTPLVLTIDKPSIVNDGVDAVTFTVKQDGVDVTTKTSICATGEGGSCLLGHTFSSTTPGTYSYYAYFAEDMTIKSNAVEITVVDPGKIEGMVFVGTTTVDDSFSLSDIRFELTPGQSGSTVDLMMWEIKFAEQMPMTLDIEVPGIGYSGTAGAFSLVAETIVPLVGGAPMADRTITGLEGSIEGEKLELNFNVGTNHVAYEGTLANE